VEDDGGDDDDNDNDNDNNNNVNIDVVEDDDNVNIDVVEDDDNDGMTTMRWRRGRINDNDAMAMGGQQHAETIYLCREFGEESTRERDNFGGGDDRKGSRWRRLSGDHFISTQSIPNVPSGHPSAEKGPEPIPHVSWE
jgi:hypothetical protein